MKMLWAIAILECSNVSPSACEVKLLSPVGESKKDCVSLISETTIEYRTELKTGTFRRAECRQYPETQRWGKQ